jgi:hypothetical protein
MTSSPAASGSPGAPAYTPFVPASASMPELTARALILGAVLGIVFASSSVYLALKAGMTLSASIPVAVLSIPVFRARARDDPREQHRPDPSRAAPWWMATRKKETR